MLPLTGSVPTYVPAAEGAPISGRSYWETSAPASAEFPAVDGDWNADIAIIGGGYTGLSAAYHLARKGDTVAVLEAHSFGWGASGRNGGMLPPRYKKGFATIARKYGHDVTRRLHGIVHEALDTVEEIVADCSINCGFVRCGQLTVAHDTPHLESLRADAEWMRAEANDSSARILDREKTLSEVGGGRHVGAWLDPRGAGLHPLRFARGFSSALRDRGVPLFERSPVTGLREEADRVLLELPSGTVSAKQVIVATNAYTDLTGFQPVLARRVVPVNSSVIATAPLAREVAAGILPSRRMVADTKHLMNWYRITPDDRLIFGGRGDITGRSDAPSTYRYLERELAETFPQAREVPIHYRWSGRVAVTLDDFPHFGRLSRRISYALGYGGRGVALSNVLGRYLARMVMGEQVEAGPMSDARFLPVPFHALRVPGMQIAAGWYRYRDRRAIQREHGKLVRSAGEGVQSA